MAMNSAIALVLVIHAHIMVGLAGPDLPDDFKKSGAVEVASFDAPSITFSAIAFGPSQLVTTTGTRKVKERWLVSEAWCSNCPAAKLRFEKAGNPESRVITIADAKQRHGKTISSVPSEYTIEIDEAVTYIQPPNYRKEWPPAYDIDGDKSPSKSKLLRYLRDGTQHQGKQWQAWYLESWQVEQLAALHSDDHNGRVPVFDEAEKAVEATITNATLSPETIAAALSAYLIPGQTPEAYGGLFDITIDTPDSARSWAADLLSKQSVEFPSAGVSASWKGSDRTISVTPGAVRIAPGVTVAVKKFGVSVSTTLTACSFDPSLSWVKLELTNAPDLTVRFK